MNRIGHIGIIPDGSRRWAKAYQFSLEDSYKKAFTRLAEFINICFTYDINSISIYLASSNNLLKRNQHDLTALSASLCFFFQENLPRILDVWHPHVIHVGSTGSICKFKFYNPLKKVLAKFTYGDKKLYVLIGYDPFEEIKAALSSLDGKMQGSDLLSKLWVPELLDIVIRSGDANTLSQFLPLQSSTARLYFLGEMFNDVTTDKFLSILEQFKNLHLKFGE